MATVHISHPKKGVVPTMRYHPNYPSLLVFGYADPGTDKVTGYVKKKDGTWAKGTTKRQPKTTGKRFGPWLIQFDFSRTELDDQHTYTLRVCPDGTTVDACHDDESTFKVKAHSSYGEITINYPNPDGGTLDVCPTFFANGVYTRGDKCYASVKVVGGSTVMGGAEAEAAAAGGIWSVEFSLDEGGNREVDARNNYSPNNDTDSQKTVNNVNTAC